MQTEILISLNELQCNRESDVSGGSEPYIWPVLLWIDNDTIKKPELVGVTAPINDPNQGLWRVVIKSDMRAGETADILSSVGDLGTGRLSDLSDVPDDQKIRFVLVAVLMWEEDNTPDDAVRAGFLVFPRELRAAVADNIFAFRAIDPANDTEVEALKSVIVERVTKAVKNAISDKISLVDIILGKFNLDDVIDSDFLLKDLSKINPDVAPPFTFTLAFGAGTSNDYVIQGELRVRNVPIDPIDPCQTQVSDVNAAQRIVDSINVRIESLQEQLQHASPVDKPSIIKKIGIQEGKLIIATDKLEVAQRALQTCRDH